MKNPFYRALAAIFCSLVFFNGCNHRPKPPPPSYEDAYFTHVIAYSGETLAIIAKWYTGASSNWHEIAAQNPDINPRKLHKGLSIQIPRNILVRTDPLPRSMLAKQSGPNTTSGMDSSTAPIAVQQPEASQPSTPESAPANDQPAAVPAPEAAAKDQATQPSTGEVQEPQVQHRSKEELLKELTKDY